MPDEQMALAITTSRPPDVVDLKVAGSFEFQAALLPSFVPEEEVFLVLRTRVADWGLKVDANGDLHNHIALRADLSGVLDPTLGAELLVTAARSAKEAAGIPELPGLDGDEGDGEWEFPEPVDTADVSSVG